MSPLKENDPIVIKDLGNDVSVVLYSMDCHSKYFIGELQE
jgi:hypothetical protein